MRRDPRIIFGTVRQAVESIRRNEAKECSVQKSAAFVYVFTPEGVGKFNTAVWNRDTAELGFPS